jgi:hypothetical protein
LTDGVDCLEVTRMSSRRGVMELIEQALTKERGVGNAEPVLEVPEVVTLNEKLGALVVVRMVERVLGVGRGDGGKQVVGDGDLSGQKVAELSEEGGGDRRRGEGL